MRAELQTESPDRRKSEDLLQVVLQFPGKRKSSQRQAYPLSKFRILSGQELVRSSFIQASGVHVLPYMTLSRECTMKFASKWLVASSMISSTPGNTMAGGNELARKS